MPEAMWFFKGEGYFTQYSRAKNLGMLPLSNEEGLLAAAVHNGVTWEDETSTWGLIL